MLNTRQIIESIKCEINDEIKSFSQKSRKRKTYIDHYELQKQVNQYYFYKIWIVEDIKLQEDVCIDIQSSNSSQIIKAIVITVHETKDFTIKTTVKLVKELYYLTTSFNPAFICQALHKVLQEDLSNHHILKNILHRLKVNKDININDQSEFLPQLNESQKQAIKLSETKQVSLIWGPPGTGKTYTLAQIIYRAFHRKESVLVLSTSNVAIDQVLLALHKLMPNHQKSIRRVGNTEDNICLQYTNSKKISQSSNSQSDNSTYPEKIIFSTLAMAALKWQKGLSPGSFDLVIVDEASMVSLAYVVLAGCMTSRNIIFAGDFQQLPPIAFNEEADYLSQNIFNYLHIPQATEQEQEISYLALLNTQYRMSAKISDLVSSLFYKNKLLCGLNNNIDDDYNQLEFINIENSSKYYGSFYSVEYESYFNPISIGLFEKIIALQDREKKVLFLTPYRGQQNILSYYIIDKGKNSHKYRALTVHKAQGSESDVVIFDLTSHTKTNRSEYAKILTSDMTANLVNVAISRAKSKLIIIGSLNMLEKLAQSNSLWKKIYQKITSDFTIQSATDLINSLPRFKIELLEEKVILAIDNGNLKGFLEYFEKSQAERKFYFSQQDYMPRAGITFRQIPKNSRFPEIIIWGKEIILLGTDRYYFVQSPMAGEVLRRILAGHLVDLSEPGASNTFTIHCPKCSSNRIVTPFYGEGYRLKCPDCNDQTIITQKIANDLKVICQVKCPKCKADVVPRKRHDAKHYEFFGCSNHPKCNGIINFSDSLVWKKEFKNTY